MSGQEAWLAFPSLSPICQGHCTMLHDPELERHKTGEGRGIIKKLMNRKVEIADKWSGCFWPTSLYPFIPIIYLDFKLARHGCRNYREDPCITTFNLAVVMRSMWCVSHYAASKTTQPLFNVIQANKPCQANSDSLKGQKEGLYSALLAYWGPKGLLMTWELQSLAWGSHSPTHHLHL